MKNNNIKQYLTLGAALAGSAFLVSCDGDDVTVAPAGQTGASSGTVDTNAPTSAQVVSRALQVTRGSNNTGTGLITTGTGRGGEDIFATTALLNQANSGGPQLNVAYSNSGSSFTLSNISVANAAAPPAITQGLLNGSVNGLTVANPPVARNPALAPAVGANIAEADEVNATSNLSGRVATLANAVNIAGFAGVPLATPSTALDTNRVINRLAFNNRLRADANLERNGRAAQPVLSIVGGEVALNGAAAAGTVAAINSPQASLDTLALALGGANSALDWALNNDPNTVGIQSLINIIEANNTGAGVFTGDADATANLANLKAAALRLQATIDAANAQEPLLVAHATQTIGAEGNDGITAGAALPELTISNWTATFNVTDSNNGSNRGVVLRGNYTESLSCTGAKLVQLASATGGFLAGEYRMEPSADVVNKSNTGSFQLSEN